MSQIAHRLISAAAPMRRGGGFGLVLAAALVAATAPAVHAQTARPAGSDAVVRIQELEAELRRVNGRLEELEHRIAKMGADAALRLGDLEFRVVTLEGGDTSVLGDPAPLGGAAPPPPVDAGPAVAVSERAAFDAAVAMIRGGRPADGRAALVRFRRDYPGSPLTGDAQHWTAEAMFLASDYRAAAQTYLANVSEHPDARVAPDSLIGLALSLEKLGNPSEACLTLAEAERRFPANAAAIARAAAERARLACK